MLAFLLWTFNIYAQELHYSQASYIPLLNNPALIGSTDCDIRAGVNYREQGKSITTPYTTQTAWCEARLNIKKLKRSWVAVGGLFVNDVAGDGHLKTTSGILMAAYYKTFNKKKSIVGSLGAGISIANRSLDMTKLYFDDQWDGAGFNNQSGEVIPSESIIYPDFNMGGMLFWQMNDKLALRVGTSIFHINKPRITFFDNQGERDENRLGFKNVIHAGAVVQVNELIGLAPYAIYSVHHNSGEVMAGSDVRWLFNDLLLHTGLGYRIGRDVIPSVGLTYHQMVLMMSYDVNVSGLHRASGYKGGFEISLSKQFCLPEQRGPCENLEF